MYIPQDVCGRISDLEKPHLTHTAREGNALEWRRSETWDWDWELRTKGGKTCQAAAQLIRKMKT